MKFLIEYNDDAISPLKNKRKKVDSFHNAIGPVLLIGQLFGQMPVSGILNKDTRNVHFKWISLRSLFSLIATLLASVELTLISIMAVKTNISLGMAGAIIFYGVCLSGNLFFIRMAKEWPKLIRLWRKSEDIFLRPPYKKWSHSLALHLRGITLTVIVLSLLEHGLYITSSAYNNKRQIDECHLNVSFFKNLYFREKLHLAKQIPYSNFGYAVFTLNNIAMTFTWSFIDVFIMALSIGIARRYNQISDRLETARGKLMPESFWIEIRTHFLAMTELLQYLDKRLSPMTLISCANNLYFICFQLFNSFHDIPLLLNKIYFWVALAFTFFRTLLMLFCASSIHDAAKKPLSVLRCVPSVAWSIEVQRFTDQVSQEVVALSGKRFFFLTRKLILAMAGTVATYELVLLDTIDDDPTPVNICDIKSLTETISGD